jgi:Fic family protein
MTRVFDYSELPDTLFNNDIVNLVAMIHEYRGKQYLYAGTEPAILEHLLEVAKVESIDASNRIEGIYTSNDRLAALVNKKEAPRNRSEEEIAGYREVLSLIHESYGHISPRPNIILQLHRDLYQFNSSALGGKYKMADNVISETDRAGNERVRFTPLSAFETQDAMTALTATLEKNLALGRYDPLLLIPLFILDFLCIHPFTDGNGRMSRLLTLLLLYRSGYIVGKYISLELIIEQSKESYYEALESSSQGWHEGGNSYLPFVRYYLGVLLKAYRDFCSRIELSLTRSKPERVRALFDQRLNKLSKSDILKTLPDISVSTVEAALAVLLKENYILKTGAGKNTAYIRNNC